MANRNKYDGGSRSNSPVGLAEREKPVSDMVSNSAQGADGRAPRDAAGKAEGGGLLDFYKPTQGRNIRLWSGISAGALICWAGYFIYQTMQAYFTTNTARIIAPIIGMLVVIVLCGIPLVWVLGKNRKACDFLIATEGEMKKVNWTSRKEIIGSTKVVIFVVVAMSILLFVVDILFMLFFSWIGILKVDMF